MDLFIAECTVWSSSRTALQHVPKGLCHKTIASHSYYSSQNAIQHHVDSLSICTWWPLGLIMDTISRLACTCFSYKALLVFAVTLPSQQFSSFYSGFDVCFVVWILSLHWLGHRCLLWFWPFLARTISFGVRFELFVPTSNKPIVLFFYVFLKSAHLSCHNLRPCRNALPDHKRSRITGRTAWQYFCCINTSAPRHSMIMQTFRLMGFYFSACCFYLSLVQPKTADKVWLRCMVHWFMGPACWWAKYLITLEHLCIKNPKKFGAMLMWFTMPSGR